MSLIAIAPIQIIVEYLFYSFSGVCKHRLEYNTVFENQRTVFIVMLCIFTQNHKILKLNISNFMKQLDKKIYPFKSIHIFIFIIINLLLDFSNIHWLPYYLYIFFKLLNSNNLLPSTDFIPHNNLEVLFY